MSTIYWRGDAASTAQVDTCVVGGTIEIGDLFKLTVGNKTLTVAAATTVVADVAALIVTTWNALTQAEAPEFYEMTAAYVSVGTFTLTADTAGKPFTLTVTTTEAGGGAADAQTFTSSTTTASSGPNDVGIAANYSGGVLPVDGDTLIFENSASSALYTLEALAAVTLASLQVKHSYTGTIGLPRTNSGGTVTYTEYRPQYFKIMATTWDIGSGDGQGSGRLKFNFHTAQYTGNIFNSGTTAEGYIPPILIKGEHTSNHLTVLKGSVGVAFFTGETSKVATLDVGYISNVSGDSTIQCGSGVTLTTILQAGGNITVNSNVTTLTQYDGKMTFAGTSTLTTGTIGGTLIDQSSGTFTTVTLLNKGTYDHSKSLLAKTITNLTINNSSIYNDPYGKTTLTNGMILNACRPEEVTINIPPGKTLTISA